MPNLFNPDYLHHLANKHHLRPSKKYGQNYLIDPAVIDIILEAAELTKDDTVIEVGPGFGTLTFALAERTQKVFAFEIEKKLEPYWGEIQENKKSRNQENNIEIVWGNVLRVIARSEERTTSPFDVAQGDPELGSNGSQSLRFQEKSVSKGIPTASSVGLGMTQKYKVVSNLPYQITSPVIRLFLEAEKQPTFMVLMVQKEVAERICAKPGDMSLLSVAVQYYADPEIITVVPRTSFWPVPGVDSAVVKITIHDLPTGQAGTRTIAAAAGSRLTAVTIQNEKEFFHLVKAGFANRRKFLSKNLEPIVGKKNKHLLTEAFAQIGLSPQVRAQELFIEQWEKLVRLLPA
ncbi:MAG TPA: rRNA adenine dimethyltransferase family protein [Patescibacteria group bacterium]|nr:rRNA adenine dimethyltransferase family protein [Patescibacteria group bacterium]